MGINTLTTPFPWTQYSKKLTAKISQFRYCGFFTEEEATLRKMHLARGQAGSVEEGNCLSLYWLIDPEDGVIVDAKFQVYGQSVLIGAAEFICEFLLRKNYDQAKRITIQLIDKELRSQPDIPAFPKETFPHLALVVEAIENAATTCSHISLNVDYVSPPTTNSLEENPNGYYEQWKELNDKQRLTIISNVLEEDIRPYIALDGGDVEVKEIVNDTHVIITYQGACTTCFSATGATLSYIQQTLQAKVFPEIQVIPDL